VRLFQSPLWETNSALLERDGEVLLSDPAFFVPEIEQIRETAGGRPTHLVLTHADFDHTCGIPFLPDAQVVAGPDTADVVASGAADDGLAAGAEWGVDWPRGVRVDRTVEAGTMFAAGPWTVEAIAAPSHGREGLGFAVLEEAVLFAGDHLSAITIPLLARLGPAIEANERLLEALGRLSPETVVPGHGPTHTTQEARTIGEADLAYLRALAAAAREAVEEGLAPGYALLHVYAVEPPRGDPPDFAIYGIRAANARAALAEAGQ